MASDCEDVDLDSLRSAVLATIKSKRTSADKTNCDDEVEQLRLAALKSKKDQNDVIVQNPPTAPLPPRPVYHRNPYNNLILLTGAPSLARFPSECPRPFFPRGGTNGFPARPPQQTTKSTFGLVLPQDRYCSENAQSSPSPKKRVPVKFSRHDSSSSESEDESDSDNESVKSETSLISSKSEVEANENRALQDDETILPETEAEIDVAANSAENGNGACEQPPSVNREYYDLTNEVSQEVVSEPEAKDKSVVPEVSVNIPLVEKRESVSPVVKYESSVKEVRSSRNDRPRIRRSRSRDRSRSKNRRARSRDRLISRREMTGRKGRSRSGSRSREQTKTNKVIDDVFDKDQLPAFDSSKIEARRRKFEANKPVDPVKTTKISLKGIADTGVQGLTIKSMPRSRKKSVRLTTASFSGDEEPLKNDWTWDSESESSDEERSNIRLKTTSKGRTVVVPSIRQMEESEKEAEIKREAEKRRQVEKANKSTNKVMSSVVAKAKKEERPVSDRLRDRLGGKSSSKPAIVDLMSVKVRDGSRSVESTARRRIVVIDDDSCSSDKRIGLVSKSAQLKHSKSDAESHVDQSTSKLPVHLRLGLPAANSDKSRQVAYDLESDATPLTKKRKKRKDSRRRRTPDNGAGEEDQPERRSERTDQSTKRRRGDVVKERLKLELGEAKSIEFTMSSRSGGKTNELDEKMQQMKEKNAAILKRQKEIREDAQKYA